MNNPLKYTDPSGYSIDGYDRNEEYYQPLGGGGSLWPKMGTVDSPRNDFEWHWQYAINIDRATKTTQATDALRNDLNKGRYNGYGIRVRPNYNWVGGKGLPTIQKQNGWLISINQSTYVSASDAANGGGHSALDYAGVLAGAGDTYFGVMGEGFHNSLYWVQKNGVLRSTKILSNTNKIYQTSYDVVGATLKTTKLIGKGFAVTGAVISTAQFMYDPTLGNAIDGIMGMTTFIPGVGWAISGTYFLTNIATEVITGKTIGQHIDEYFTEPSGTW